ncbi:hypothetical protein [Methanoregula sp.]|uniref:hypothetical protein n=1 Tax=Methanoregula sp. TaxID=2052170 RepID=UPI003BB17E6F
MARRKNTNNSPLGNSPLGDSPLGGLTPKGFYARITTGDGRRINYGKYLRDKFRF